MGDTPKVQINLTDSEVERIVKALESIADSLQRMAYPRLVMNIKSGEVRNLDAEERTGPPWRLNE